LDVGGALGGGWLGWAGHWMGWPASRSMSVMRYSVMDMSLFSATSIKCFLICGGSLIVSVGVCVGFLPGLFILVL